MSEKAFKSALAEATKGLILKLSMLTAALVSQDISTSDFGEAVADALEEYLPLTKDPNDPPAT